jgi:PKD repeat protein
MAAVTTDAFADNVTFYRSVVMPAVHVGSVRTTGASGNADRDLGDYMSCDVDKMGRLIMTFGNDGDDGIGQYNSKVMVARQTGGPFLKAGVGPVARFTHSLDGMKVSVDGRQSYDMNGKGITAFRWDWGDGTNTTEKNDTAASHTYRNAGRYELRLQVTNPDNMTGSDSVMLNVRVAPAETNWMLLGGLGAVAAVAAVVAVWWKYGKGKLKFPKKSG